MRKDKVADIVSQYRFAECLLIEVFIAIVNDDVLVRQELIYIERKIKNFLWNNDNHDAFFHPLRNLAVEIRSELRLDNSSK